MLCQFERLVYPKNAQAVTPTSYMVAIYRPCETLTGVTGAPMTQIKAVGFCLPLSGNLRYELKGSWKRDPKHGMQYEVEQYDEILIPTKEGILAYLSSGQIKGVGPKVAERIYVRLISETTGYTVMSVFRKLLFCIGCRRTASQDASRRLVVRQAPLSGL